MNIRESKGGTTKDSRAAAIAVGQRVLATEAEALVSLAGMLGESFADSVDLLFKVRGRVVLSGMGKSGHVARKIAATLASTGTPAQFVHPAEASHGDLGMITAEDALIVLSNSGETRELADVVAHSRRFRVPLIGIARRAGSTLLKASDIALILPAAPEAGPGGLAPTTSTTLSMALGDAIAIALMERRGFTAEHFRIFHPGGSLGARLVSVGDLMATGEALPLIRPETPMTEALIEMSAKSFGVAGVVDAKGHLSGIITDGDLRRRMEGLLDRRAGEVATADPLTIAPDRLAQEALAIMNARRITCLFVTDGGTGGRPLGLIHLHHCLNAGVDEA